MKKLFLSILALGLLLNSNAFGETIELTCQLVMGKISISKDHRYDFKTTKISIDTKKNLITNIETEGDLFVLTGIKETVKITKTGVSYRPHIILQQKFKRKSFDTNGNFSYSNTIELKDSFGESKTIDYFGIVSIGNKLIHSFLNVKGTYSRGKFWKFNPISIKKKEKKFDFVLL